MKMAYRTSGALDLTYLIYYYHSYLCVSFCVSEGQVSVGAHRVKKVLDLLEVELLVT